MLDTNVISELVRLRPDPNVRNWVAATDEGLLYLSVLTLGEIRNRADVLLFWGTDPAARYPRFLSRYAPDPPGVHVPQGRASRTVIAVDIGSRLLRIRNEVFAHFGECSLGLESIDHPGVSRLTSCFGEWGNAAFQLFGQL